MSRGPYEVQAGMDPEINLVLPLRLLLLAHVGLMLVINEVNNGCPGVTVVDVVAKARRVNDRQLSLELLLLELRLDDLNLGELVELLVATTVVVLGRVQLGSEKRVDQGRLTKTGFT